MPRQLLEGVAVHVLVGEPLRLLREDPLEDHFRRMQAAEAGDRNHAAAAVAQGNGWNGPNIGVAAGAAEAADHRTALDRAEEKLRPQLARAGARPGRRRPETDRV